MSEAALEQQSVRDPVTSRFAKGNRTGGRPFKREATVDELRSGVLCHCSPKLLKKVLDGMATKNPVEYAKLAVSLIPKKDDAVVTRVVSMSFETVTSLPDTPDEVLESTPGDDTSAEV